MERQFVSNTKVFLVYRATLASSRTCFVVRRRLRTSVCVFGADWGFEMSIGEGWVRAAQYMASRISKGRERKFQECGRGMKS